jgi:hypothetical protein
MPNYCVIPECFYRESSSLSDLRLIYYGKAGFGHISRIFLLNSQLFALKAREICLKPVFPSLRSLKSDRLLAALLDPR